MGWPGGNEMLKLLLMAPGLRGLSGFGLGLVIEGLGEPFYYCCYLCDCVCNRPFDVGDGVSLELESM